MPRRVAGFLKVIAAIDPGLDRIGLSLAMPWHTLRRIMVP